MARRQYTDQDRAEALAALAANGGNVKRTAQAIGIPRKTLESWSREIQDRPEVADGDGHVKKRQPLAERLPEVIHTAMDALPGKAEGASFQQITVGIGILIDKLQLLTGRPTEIHADGDRISEDERAELRRKLAERGLLLPMGGRAVEVDERNGHGNGQAQTRPDPDLPSFGT
jgi:transposase-like protein